jgi:hypothetical protein
MVMQRTLIHFGLMARQLARYLAFCLAFCLAVPVAAQSQNQAQSVEASDLQLTVTVEPMPATPMRQEMILLTIHGIYKRHITLERLEQPDFAGFNWMQLGEDHWFESMLDGRPVKNMRRRMAIFPNEAGILDIAPFRHHLTLLDKDNKWFEHTSHNIMSDRFHFVKSHLITRGPRQPTDVFTNISTGCFYTFHVHV